MIKRLSTLLLLALISGQAIALSDEEKQAIDELLVASGSFNTGLNLANLGANAMVNSLTRSNSKITAQIAARLKTEIIAIVEDDFIANRFWHEMSYEVYSKHFDLQEIRTLTAFYQSDVGRKLVRVQPQIAQESTLAAQKRFQALAPAIEKKVRALLADEGVL